MPNFNTIVLATLPLLHLSNAAFSFNNYPLCAQPILYDIAPPACDYGSNGTTEAEMTDACLCINEGYLQSAAQQIYQTCGCPDLVTSAQVNSDNCAKFQTNSAFSVVDFINAGSSTCNNTSSGPLDAGTIVGIVFGIVGFFALLVGVLQLLVMLKWIPTGAAPWPKIKSAFSFCFPCC